MIPDSFIQELLARIDLVDLIDRHVSLKKSGTNFSACCPFHGEKTPSFTVSPVKQFYHCFGCGAHGSAIGFLMAYSGLSFPDAVRELAKSVGMVVPVDDAFQAAGPVGHAHTLTEILAQAGQFYHAELNSVSSAKDYLTLRGVNDNIISLYGLGWAPDAWGSLRSVFKDYDEQSGVMNAGLVVAHDSGRRYDRFRGRIMFPIVDMRGQTIGFGGRLTQSGEPKYLNSPETAVFSKSRALYGFHQARAAIRAADQVFVVEGYMDVLALAQHGIQNCVATLGTACTEEHLRLLLKQASRIYFCFDGDSAGEKAAWRALEHALPHVVDHVELRFMFLPAKEDPDSYVRRQGAEAFIALSKEAISLSSYLVKELSREIDLSAAEGRARLLLKAKPFLQKLVAPNLRNDLKNQFADLARVSEREASRALGLGWQKYQSTVQPREDRRVVSLPRRLTELLFMNPSAYARIDLPELVTESTLVGKSDLDVLLAAVRLCQVSEEDALLAELIERSPLREYLQAAQAAAIATSWTDPAEWSTEFEDGLTRLRQYNLEKEVAGLTQKMSAQGLSDEERQRLVTCVTALSVMKRPIARTDGEAWYNSAS